MFTNLGGDAAGTSINLSALFVRTSPTLLLLAAAIGAVFQIVAVDGGFGTRDAVSVVPALEEEEDTDAAAAAHDGSDSEVEEVIPQRVAKTRTPRRS